MAKKSAATAAELASMGGIARKNALSPEQRSEIARNAVMKRWASVEGNELPTVTHGDEDHPLRIGELELPCYVLDDKRRVLAQRGMITALSMKRGRARKGGGDRLASFASGKAISPFVNDTLRAAINNPIIFRAGGSIAYGYEATILADICEAVIAADQDGKLQRQQKHIAQQCRILLRGFSNVGIIALVDEATGYQLERPRRELEEQLKKFLSESLRRWVRTFPADYFKELCRLRGVEFRADMRLPKYFGILTNRLVYRRLAPGLLKRLKERRNERGSASNKLHSWLSLDVGFPEVLVHLGMVVGLMKLHDDYEKFEKQLDQIAPIYPETPGLFDDPKDWEPRG